MSGVDLVLELVDAVVFDVGGDRAVAVMRRDVSEFNVEVGIGQNVVAVDVDHAAGFVVESVDGQVVLLVRARDVVVEVPQKRPVVSLVVVDAGDFGFAPRGDVDFEAVPLVAGRIDAAVVAEEVNDVELVHVAQALETGEDVSVCLQVGLVGKREGRSDGEHLQIVGAEREPVRVVGHVGEGESARGVDHVDFWAADDLLAAAVRSMLVAGPAVEAGVLLGLKFSSFFARIRSLLTYGFCEGEKCGGNLHLFGRNENLRSRFSSQ